VSIAGENARAIDRSTAFVYPVLFCGLCLCFMASREVT